MFQRNPSRIGLLVNPNKPNPWDVLKAVQARPALVSFGALGSIHIREGHSATLLKMLMSFGCPPALANEIIEGWPTPATRKLPDTAFSYPEEVACYIACYVPEFEKLNWPALLSRAMQIQLVPPIAPNASVPAAKKPTETT